jgi:hypothetical protein
VANTQLMELLQRVFPSEVVGQRHVRAFNQHVGLLDVLLELIPELLVGQAVGAQQEAPVLGDQMVDTATTEKLIVNLPSKCPFVGRSATSR